MELSNFQCNNRQYCQKNADNPESSYNFRLRNIFLLKMMMYWRHQKDTTPLAVLLFRIFKIRGLDNYRKALHKEYTTKNWQ